MNLVAFFRWQFQGSLRSLSFWGFMLFVVAIVMLLLGWSPAWFAAMIALALSLMLVDAGISWFRFSYSLFEMEQTPARSVNSTCVTVNSPTTGDSNGTHHQRTGSYSGRQQV